MTDIKLAQVPGAWILHTKQPRYDRHKGEIQKGNIRICFCQSCYKFISGSFVIILLRGYAPLYCRKWFWRHWNFAVSWHSYLDGNWQHFNSILWVFCVEIKWFFLYLCIVFMYCIYLLYLCIVCMWYMYMSYKAHKSCPKNIWAIFTGIKGAILSK